MFSNFETYYRRMNIFQLTFGVLLIISGALFVISDPVFFSGMAVSFFGPMLLRAKKDKRLAVKADRLRILRENKSIAWKAVGLVYILPLSLGLVAYYGFRKPFTSAGFIFVGVSALCSALINKMVMPLHKTHNTEVFD